MIVSINLKTLMTALVAVSFISASLAQDEPELEPEPEEKKGNTFTVIELADLPFEKMFYRSKGKPVLVQLRGGRRSTSYSVPSSDYLELFAENNDPDNPEIKYKLIGKTQLVKSTKSLYFLRPSTSKEEGVLPVEIYGIDDSESAFPESSFRFINFMKAPLAIQFDKDQFLIKPNDITVRKVRLTDAGSFIPFVVRDSKTNILGGTRIFSHASNREMILIFPPKQGKKRLDIRFYSD